MNKVKNNKKYRSDLILIAALLAAGAVLCIILMLTMKTGGTVQVTVDGKTVKTFPLDKDTSYEIAGFEGGRNMLVIKDGQAWIEEADCPDGLCVNMGRISKNGQSVICLPHRVVVSITDENGTTDDVDVYVK